LGNITVAVLGAPSYSANLGKKGTSTDITLYNLKRGDDTVTFIEPTRYPERLAPLFYAVALAKKVVIVVDEVNAMLGECLVMLQCSGLHSGYLVLRNYISKERVSSLIKGTSLEHLEFVNDDPNMLRESLLKEAAEQKPARAAEGQQMVGMVPVDHAFNVKGVGTVVLGVVVSGIVQKHSILNVLPIGKSTQIRSIQKHDDEFDVAWEGDRIGLALKNVEVEDLDRGTVLADDPSVKTSTILQIQASLVPYWQMPIKPGMVMHIGHWMQFLTARVETEVHNGDWRKTALTLTLDKPLIYHPNDHVVLMYLENGKLRVAGTAYIS
jgi:selenocysteine-specific translation elongation factor